MLLGSSISCANAKEKVLKSFTTARCSPCISTRIQHQPLLENLALAQCWSLCVLAYMSSCASVVCQLLLLYFPYLYIVKYVFAKPWHHFSYKVVVLLI